MPASLLTTLPLQKLESVSEVNRILLKDFYEYMQSKDHKSEGHIISLLTLLISLDKFYSEIPFTSINTGGDSKIPKSPVFTKGRQMGRTRS